MLDGLRIAFILLPLTQEFMVLPVGASSFKEAMKMGVEVYHHLKVGVYMCHLLTLIIFEQLFIVK